MNDLPQPNDKRIALHIKPAAERALRAGHPWLFEDSIRQQSRTGAPGDLAVIFDKKDRFLAIGLYDPDSPIRVKVLHHGTPAQINRDWFAGKIQAAVQHRAPLAQSDDTTGYRLLHGENDGLPGLVVDRYDKTLVLKLYTAAWLPYLREIVLLLQDAQPHEALVLRLSRNLQGIHGLTDGQVLYGAVPEDGVLFTENGLRFRADVRQGHKTGFFFDQRENRALAAKYAAHKHVLDVFTYVGAFSLYAALGGAKHVLSLDVSAPALAEAERNFALNPSLAAVPHEALVMDAFAGLRQLTTEQRQFELVIVDPPAFAKRQDEVPGALDAYAQLVQLALDVLVPGGVLVMASCSSRVEKAAFFDRIHQTARQAGRPLTEHQRTGHARDHPVGFPEGEYLKCLFATAK